MKIYKTWSRKRLTKEEHEKCEIRRNELKHLINFYSYFAGRAYARGFEFSENFIINLTDEQIYYLDNLIYNNRITLNNKNKIINLMILEN